MLPSFPVEVEYKPIVNLDFEPQSFFNHMVIQVKTSRLYPYRNPAHSTESLANKWLVF